MISARLLTLVRCPSCRVELTRGSDAAMACQRCGHQYSSVGVDYLDLRPATSFADVTKYVDEAFHADGRHEHVSPPLLSAGIRNDMLRRFLRIGGSDRVVDLGCGSGRVLVWNCDTAAHLAGIDASPHFAAEARARVDLMVGDLRRLPLADGAFTKAFSLDVLEHLSRKALVEVLREAARVLEPGGQLFVYTHVRKNSALALGLRFTNWVARQLDRLGLIDLSYERLRKSDHLNPLADIPDLERAVTAAGFRIDRIRYYTPIVGGVIENILLRLAERWFVVRAARSLKADGSDTGAAVRAAHRQAQARIERRGAAYAVLVALTWIMKLDLVLFGRIRSGPFFALLTRTAP